MRHIQEFFITLISLMLNCAAHTQSELVLSQHGSPLRVIVIRKDFPLLKILLPGQPVSERGIEVEFPEHVTGLNKSTNEVEHLYLVTNGTRNKRTNPVWKIDGNAIQYETTLNDDISMIARVELEPDGVRWLYILNNRSKNSYEHLQAVTCVKLYSVFSDVRLERTYVHHANGFDLLASETPRRLTMPLEQWLPCRYLVSYNWPVPVRRFEKGEDSITRYNKSRKADKPFIATLSQDTKWVAATYTSETGNLWTNPERSCQHADPAVLLKAGDTKRLELKTFIFPGNLNQLLQHVDDELSKNGR